MTNFEKVGFFMKTFGQDVKQSSSFSSDKINALRVNLIKEELDELIEAMNKKDLVEVADALTDILYVTYGAGHAFGINLDDCFEEVQNSNMSKLDNNGKPIYNENGKVMKGPNYFKPDFIENHLMIKTMTEKFIRFRKLFIIGLLVSIFVIFVNSSIDLYLKRNTILGKLGIKHYVGDHHNEKRFLINPLEQSDRQIPPLDIKDLKINKNSDVVGQWTAPIDWNVTAIHSILLPDETVMTFGSFGIDKKEIDKDIRANKKLTITNGRELERDGGFINGDNDVNSGIDFDIWDPKKGVGDDSHILFKQPVVMDAFCSVVRVQTIIEFSL